ncbi:GNAT family N-acetyltransferase [Veronia nyctiphanis]|uniref:GNAT family N-acetyltransferase n=1 Tax=Veronia nyctiphanis TaxID=1278244 RepID=A0A4Q0YPH8_9GAMM|nr:GNAT family N-acetyltransferase [Veronia nyctiphanis]RXJ72856.1 GNAT family N-acetyltransferase [Veronia nyctiphanis]
MEVNYLDWEGNYEDVLNVLLSLRPSYDIETLKTQIKRQQQQGYQVVYVSGKHGVLAVAGFVISEKLAWGKHIYIDDLVTNPEFRSTGVGAFLMSWFKALADEKGCGQIHLDSGVQRFAAHKFYLREGFNIASHHFSYIKD